MLDSKEEIPFQLYTATREEFLFHLRQRDLWLKFQLITQGTLLALVNGIEVAFATSSSPKYEVLGFSVLISLIFGCLYFVEDNLIGYLVRYLVRFNKSEQLNFPNGLEGIESSKEMSEYSRMVRPYRDLTSLIIFIGIPVYLGIIRFSKLDSWDALVVGEFILDLLLLSILIGLVYRTFSFRREVLPVASPQDVNS